MSEFSDRPFAAGSLTGLRAFEVDSLGRLKGPHYGGVFKPGENVARCHNTFGPVFTTMGRMLSFHEPEDDNNQTMLPPKPPKVPKHQVGQQRCSCGFYAYYDGRNDYKDLCDDPGSRIEAVIEGYGVCTVGDRGFRAEKARLVALVAPNPRWWRRVFGYWQWSATWVGICSFLLGSNLFHQNWILAGVDALLVALNGWFCWRAIKHKQKHPSPDLVERMELVQRNYPDVPVYRTRKEALSHHPLTVPEVSPPTPDDADFWVREA